MFIKPLSIENINITQVPPPKPPKKPPPLGFYALSFPNFNFTGNFWRIWYAYASETSGIFERCNPALYFIRLWCLFGDWKEINDRTTTQSLLYEQNEQLWKYLHDLLHVHNQNAKIVKDQVLNSWNICWMAYISSQIRALHAELAQVHQERQEMAEELQRAVGSQKVNFYLIILYIVP